MSVNSKQLAVTSEGSPQTLDLSPQENTVDVPKLEVSEPLNPLPPSEDSPLAGGELTSTVPQKTQCLRPSRGSGVEVLGSAAERAVRSGRRNDVHEYMRLRRSFV